MKLLKQKEKGLGFALVIIQLWSTLPQDTADIRVERGPKSNCSKPRQRDPSGATNYEDSTSGSRMQHTTENWEYTLKKHHEACPALLAHY